MLTIRLVFGKTEYRQNVRMPPPICSIVPILPAQIPSVPMGINFALAVVRKPSRPYFATASA